MPLLALHIAAAAFAAVALFGGVAAWRAADAVADRVDVAALGDALRALEPRFSETLAAGDTPDAAAVGALRAARGQIDGDVGVYAFQLRPTPLIVAAAGRDRLRPDPAWIDGALAGEPEPWLRRGETMIVGVSLVADEGVVGGLVVTIAPQGAPPVLAVAVAAAVVAILVGALSWRLTSGHAARSDRIIAAFESVPPAGAAPIDPDDDADDLERAAIAVRNRMAQDLARAALAREGG